MTVFINQSALATFAPWDGLETGWLLLGSWAPNGDWFVQKTIDAGPNALRNVGGLSMDKPYQAGELIRLRKTDRGLMVLGVVHTHHPNNSTPSDRDLEADRKWVRGLKQGFGIFGIIAGSDLRWWILRSGEQQYEPIEVRAT